MIIYNKQKEKPFRKIKHFKGLRIKPCDTAR